MVGTLMSYHEWMKLTAATGKPRSKELKAVDKALKQYEEYYAGSSSSTKQELLAQLQKALQAWKIAQGPGDAWKKSVRNRNLAVEQLTAQLAGGDSEAAWGRVPNFMHPEFEHARLGVLYLLGKLRVRPDMFSIFLEGGLAYTGSVLSFCGGKVIDGGLGDVAVDTAQNFFNTAMVPGNMILNAANSAALDTHVDPAKRSLFEKVRQLFADFIVKTLQVIKEKLGDTELTYASVKNLGILCSKLFLDTTGYGLVSGAVDTFKGAVNLVNASVDKFREYLKSRHVVLMSGHPGTVVESIRRAMTLSLLEGVWQTLKGAGNIGLAFATWGTSMIVGVVTACFEMIIKYLWRLVELCRMERMFTEAAIYWRDREQLALHKKPFAFHRWYRKWALTLPAVAVLTLNSGICGDKMVYLSLFQGDGTPITSDQFLKGASYLDHLKVWGTSYLDKCGFAFYSSDPFVSAILGHARSHVAHLSRAQKVWAEISKFANA